MAVPPARLGSAAIECLARRGAEVRGDPGLGLRAGPRRRRSGACSARHGFASVAARVLLWSGKLAEAEAEYDSILTAVPNDPDHWLGLSQVYSREGRTREALQALDRAVALAPATKPCASYWDA